MLDVTCPYCNTEFECDQDETYGECPACGTCVDLEDYEAQG
jgi:hypothetical protein